MRATFRHKTNLGVDTGNILIGLWIVTAPFVLDYSYLIRPFWTHVATGLLILALVLFRITGSDRHGYSSWLTVLLGIWLIVSPFVLNFRVAPAPVWNSIVAGIVTSCVALATVSMPHSAEHQPYSG